MYFASPNFLYTRKTISKSSVFLDTYCIKKRINRVGGGVGVYIRNELNFVEREDLSGDVIEAIFVEIKPNKVKGVIDTFELELGHRLHRMKLSST